MRSTINNTIKYSPNEVVFSKHLSSFRNDGTEIKPVNIEEHLKNVTHNRKRINESLEKKSGEVMKSNDRIKAGYIVIFKSEAKGLLKNDISDRVQ